MHSAEQTSVATWSPPLTTITSSYRSNPPMPRWLHCSNFNATDSEQPPHGHSPGYGVTGMLAPYSTKKPPDQDGNAGQSTRTKEDEVVRRRPAGRGSRTILARQEPARRRCLGVGLGLCRSRDDRRAGRLVRGRRAVPPPARAADPAHGHPAGEQGAGG